MAQRKQARDNEGPGETQEELADRQVPASVKAIASTHAEAASNRVLQPRRLETAETAFNRWNVIVDPGTTKEDLERTSYWTHHTQKLRRHDEIRAVCADGSFMADLIVRAVGPKEALVTMKQYIELESVSPDALDVPSGYTVDWAGDIAKWRVLRGQEQVREGFETKGQAQKWLSDHVQSLAR